MITHCVCFNLSFQKILEIAKEDNLKFLHQIQKRHNICNKCRRCNSYIREALVTGQTNFKVIHKQ
jgi:bacterioferritin-associated ferredoxin